MYTETVVVCSLVYSVARFLTCMCVVSVVVWFLALLLLVLLYGC